MAQAKFNGVVIENTLTPKMQVLAKLYRHQIMEGVAATFDKIRQVAADKYIIPNKYPNERRPWILYKKQRTDPTRLTSRTGSLLKMLRINGKWIKGDNRRIYKYESPAIQCAVKVMTKGINAIESYEGTLSAVIKDAEAVRPAKFKDLEGKSDDIRKSRTKDVTQDLYFRFKWDMASGIRGKRRPFLTAAAQEQELSFNHVVEEKLRAIGAI